MLDGAYHVGGGGDDEGVQHRTLSLMAVVVDYTGGNRLRMSDGRKVKWWEGKVNKARSGTTHLAGIWSQLGISLGSR